MGRNYTLTWAPAVSISPLSIDASTNFFRASGAPILLHGESAWLWAAQPTDTDQNTYLADRASRGINAIYVQAIARPTDHTAGSDANGVFAFTAHTSTTADFSTYNATYFNRLRDFIRRAAAKGIYVFLSPCYLGFNSDIADGWATVLAAQSAGVAQAYGASIATTMAAEPNIVWLMGGDSNASGTTLSREQSLITGIKSVLPSALFTSHNDQTGMPSSALDPPWANLGSGKRVNAVYTWSRTPYTQAEGIYGAGDPLAMLEVLYENNNIFAGGWSAALGRQQIWNCFLAGTFAIFYGNEQIWPAGSTNTNAQSGPNWATHLADSGITHQKIWHDAMRVRNFSALVPDSGSALVTAGRQTHGSETYVGAAKTADSKLGVIYIPDRNNTITIGASQMASTYNVTWLDPTNGSLTAASGSPFSAGSSHTLSRGADNAAGGTDFVALLEAP